MGGKGWGKASGSHKGQGKDQGKGKDKGKRGSQGKSGEGKTKGKFAVPMPDDQVLSCKWACNIRGYPDAGEENSWRSIVEVFGVENGHDIKFSGETGKTHPTSRLARPTRARDVRHRRLHGARRGHRLVRSLVALCGRCDGVQREPCCDGVHQTRGNR